MNEHASVEKKNQKNIGPYLRLILLSSVAITMFACNSERPILDQSVNYPSATPEATTSPAEIPDLMATVTSIKKQIDSLPTPKPDAPKAKESIQKSLEGICVLLAQVIVSQQEMNPGKYNNEEMQAALLVLSKRCNIEELQKTPQIKTAPKPVYIE